MINLAITQDVVSSFGRDCGKNQAWPTLRNENTGEVLHMQALLDQDDHAFRRVVQPTHGRVVEPIAGALKGYNRIGVIRFAWIINGHKFATAPGQRSAYRGRQAISTTGGL